MLKTIDKLLIRSYLPPFAAAVFIALFVLIMQSIWQLISHIVGKGVSTLLVAEMLGYMSISLVPLALPIGVLIASVMVYGNLAEKFELSSMKSAGVSLMRIMRGTLIIALLISGFSFLCSNYFIPVSNLKFKTRLLDIKKQKPTLNLEEGIFNYDFSGYAIRIGKKDPDGIGLNDVLIYDHRNAPSGKMVNIRAESGEMYMSEDGKFLIMKLRNGVQYREMAEEKGKFRPLLRATFKSWQKIFDLQEFEMKRSDEDLYKDHYTMLSVRQLARAEDTLAYELKKMRLYNMRDFFPEKRKTVVSELESSNKQPDQVKQVEGFDEKGKPAFRNLQTKTPGKDAGVTRFVQTFEGKDSILLANRVASHIKSRTKAMARSNQHYQFVEQKRLRHIYEYHSKFALAIVCFLFLFVGGPMGAIIRKGGYGYPLLVTIIFFVIYIVLTIACREATRNIENSPVMLAWLPDLVFMPIGAFLTLKAMSDTKFLDFGTRIAGFIKKLGRKE